jgi:hypothetical protein
VSPDDVETEDAEADEMASAPESGQIPGGREDPWEGDTPSPSHPWPCEHHAAPKDEL